MATYSEKWINNSDRAFERALADIEPKSAGEAPPSGFKLEAGAEKTMSWTLEPHERVKTLGYIRWWSIPATSMPGSGLTFGVKVEHDFSGPSVPFSPSISTYYGAGTANPNAWTDVTANFREGTYTFQVKGEHDKYYDVTINRLIGGSSQIGSVEITVKNTGVIAA